MSIGDGRIRGSGSRRSPFELFGDVWLGAIASEDVIPIEGTREEIAAASLEVSLDLLSPRRSKPSSRNAIP